MSIAANPSAMRDRHATVLLRLRTFEFFMNKNTKRSEFSELMREAFVDIDDEARPCWRMLSGDRFRVLWDAAFGEPDFDSIFPKLAWSKSTTRRDIAIGAGDELRFDLVAHPTVSRKSGLGARERGKRQHITSMSGQLEWLHKRFESAARVRVLEHTSRRIGGAGQRDYEAASFSGAMVVADPFELARMIRCGVGPSKHAGFGMLEIRTANPPIATIDAPQEG